MPAWVNKTVSLFLVFTLFLGFVKPVIAAGGQVVTYTPPITEQQVTTPPQQQVNSTGATKPTTSASDKVKEKAKGLFGVMDSLMLTLAGSPLLMRVIAVQMQKFSNDKVKKWARESYFLVDQAVAHAERTGKLPGDKSAKAKLYQDQFGKILKEAGWLERVALRTGTGQEKHILEKAMKEAESIHRKTFYGEIAELEAEGRITQNEAMEFLGIRRRGMMTPRELGAYLLDNTNLKSREVLELMRTYVAKDADVRVRVKGMRDSRFDATVLELMEPWKDAKRTTFQTRVDRKTVAKMMAFDGSVEDFTRLVIAESGVSGAEAQKLVDEYANEKYKTKQFAKQAEVEQTKKTVGDGPSRPKNTYELNSYKPLVQDVVNHHNNKPVPRTTEVKSTATQQPSRPINTADSVVKQPALRPAMAQGTATKQPALRPAMAQGTATKQPAVRKTVTESYRPATSERTVNKQPVHKPAIAQTGQAPVKTASATNNTPKASGTFDFKRGRSKVFNKWTGGGLKGAKQSLHYDAFRGGVFIDVGITAATNLFFRLKQGDSLGESIKGTAGTIMSTEFILGDLLGGAIGAAVGASIPLPAAIQSMGLFGKFLGVLPGISFAIAGAQLGYGAISLMKRGQFSMKALFNEVKPGLLLGQALGAALGMTLGTLLLPGPIGALLGGIIGGILGSKLAAAIFGYGEEQILSQAAHIQQGNPSAPTTVAGEELEGINLTMPSSDDMSRLDEAVREAYATYMDAQRKGDYRNSVSSFKRYVELQKVLDELKQRGYRVK